MHRLARLVLAVLGPVLTGSLADASPRDEVLRVAPSDTAFVFLLQNARTHYQQLADSPFAQWMPTTAIGKQYFESTDHKQLRQSLGKIFSDLGTSPSELFDEILGDAVLFAFSEAPAAQPARERAIIIIGPRKPEALSKLIEKVNEIQTRSGEVKAAVRKEHRGVAYQERQKASGSEFYCFRGQLFIFSAFEAELTSAIDRDLDAAPTSEKAPQLLVQLKKLEIADSPFVALVHPRALDAEMQSRLASAKPDEKRFLARFKEIWSALEIAAIDVSVEKSLELGVTLRFHPEKLPPDGKKWLTGPRTPTIAERLIPDNALLGFSAQFRATELIDIMTSLAPVEAGKPDIKNWINGAIGPIVGRDKLALVLDALGPNWAVWVEPPSRLGVLPTFVAAVEISGENEARKKAEKALQQTLDFAFSTARVAYNTTHPDPMDQMQLKEEDDKQTGATITSLIHEKAFPPGVSPSYAFVKGYLVIATSPEAIKRFRIPPVEEPGAQTHATIARFSGSRTREYLAANGPHLARFMSDLGVGKEQSLREQLGNLASVLELVESAELIAKGRENGLRIGLRIIPAKPLKKG